ncbi:MAG: hypothetical protein L3J45_07875 [Flavobacteriaceae bacterium]|nr:hypothetical protein [Flavobacteriaceae bacterium]
MKKLIFILCMVFTLAFANESFANTKTPFTKNETMQLTKSKPDFVVPICWFEYTHYVIEYPNGTKITYTHTTVKCAVIVI